MYRPLPQQLPALDGLRGMAALIVLFAHCANESWLPSWMGAGFGQAGVVLFYALSGFLMQHFAIDRPFDRSSLRRYAVARVSRVLPLYFLCVAITTVPFLVTGRVSFYGVDEPGDLIRSWLLYQGVGVLWSVPVEVHFYLLFPILWWAHCKGRFLAICIATLAACAVLAWLVPNPDPSTFIPFWLHWFVIGALVRWLLDDGRRNRISIRALEPGLRIAAWFCFALLVLLPPELRGVAKQMLRIDPLPLLLVPLILWFAAAGLGPFRLFAIAWLRWYGSISYGLYLAHSPVMSMIKYLEINLVIGALPSFLLTLAASTLAAALSLRLFERPAQDWLRARYASPSIAAQ